MNCPKCGKDNPSDNKFCDNCGNEIAAAPAAPTPVPATAGECPECKHVNPPDSAFCENCGAPVQNAAPSPIVTPIAPPQAPIPQPQIGKSLVCPDGSEIALQTRKSIGRLDLSKYASPTEARWISRLHFEVFEEKGESYIQDEKSLNGTKLNGKEIRALGKQLLRNGDEIIVGDAVKLLFKVKSP
jgi:hypothetical protein